MTPVDWSRFDAVLFDLDGVLTPTADVHHHAWTQMFNEFLAAKHPDQPPFGEEDYFAYIDGKPRFDGVRSFLASRRIVLPEGDLNDPPSMDTVRASATARTSCSTTCCTRRASPRTRGRCA